jgi:hypothetical protein
MITRTMLATENYRQRQRNFTATKTLLGKREARDPGATRNEEIGYPPETPMCDEKNRICL